MTRSPSRSRPIALLVAPALGMLTLVVGPTNAVATTGATATTEVSEVVAHRFADGDPAGLGYKVTHEVTAPMSPGDAFPSVRVDPAEHPEAFDGQWSDAGYHASWISPAGEFQYLPDAYTIEGGYFDNAIASDGVALAPGDSVDIAVKQLPGDAPLTWDRQRGSADGEMRWDVTSRSQVIGATYGETSKEIEVVFVRADLVARGGDFDARDASAQLPPLVIDLPRTYGPETRASAAVTQFSPYLHYINAVEGQILPQAGKAIITARTRGYIPEEREVTLPNGTHVREWHIPLNLVINLYDASGGTLPLSERTATHLPSGGVVSTFGDAGQHRIAVPPGGTVLSGAGLVPTLTTAVDRTRASEEDRDASAAPSTSSGTLMDDIEATGGIDHTLDAPVELQIAKRSYGLTIDPNLGGQGVLGISSVSHLRTGQPHFETAAVPYVSVDGELITLERSRLVDLRVVPQWPWISIGFSSLAGGGALDPNGYVTSRWGRIQRPAVNVEAVYDLGNDRYAFLSAFAQVNAGATGDVVEMFLNVRSFNGAPATISAVQYMELAEPGPITYDGEVMTTEFTGPSKALKTPRARILGGATGRAQMTVVRAGAPMSTQPTADPAISIDGQPIGVYITPTAASTDGSYQSILLSWLDDVSSRQEVSPAPIDQPCIDPQVVDDGTSDGPAGLDITRAWFDFDGVNLYSTIELARLDENVLGSPATFRSSWRFEHVGYGLQAARDVTGAWTYRIGLHSSAGTPWNPINSVPVVGELIFGSPGYIRMSSPVDVELSGTGFLDGETLRDTGATSFDTNGVQDRAPQGATDVAYGRGADYVVATCPGQVLATILQLAPISDTTGQYSDTVTLVARLTDASGAPVEGATIDFALGSTPASATTDASGLATTTFELGMAPGPVPVSLSFPGRDGLEPSTATGEIIVTHEDSALSFSSTGNGSKKTLQARLADADTPTNGIAGRSIEFYADGSLIGTATTDAEGIATLQAPPGARGARETFEVRFLGDGFFRASSAR